MKRKLSKNSYLPVIAITILFIVIATGITVGRHNRPNAPDYTTRVVSVFDRTALDGPSGYILENGKTVTTSCGFCSTVYTGAVTGNPQVGDTVEVNVNADGELIGKDTYIRKIQ